MSPGPLSRETAPEPSLGGTHASLRERTSGCRRRDRYGEGRPKNEDQYLIASLRRVIEIEETSIPIEGRRVSPAARRPLLLLVADGVGGGKGGQEASSRTVDTIVRYVAGSSLFFANLGEDTQRALLHDLVLSVQWSHAAVRNEAASRTSLEAMATTLTMVFALWPRAYVVQVGDSRCYHLRRAALTQVTRDQTLAQDMVDQGLIPASAAERSPLSHVLSQAVGAARRARSRPRSPPTTWSRATPCSSAPTA